MFLVFEGIDGSGKSTQACLLEKYLRRERRLSVLLVREPGGTRLGERVRDLVLSPSSGDLAAETELFLFMAARSHLVRSRILPALEAGRIVISDRFLWSSVVYQGYAAGVRPQEIFRMGRLAVAGLRATRTFLIDLDPKEAFLRIRDRNRMEDRGLQFQRRVRTGFLALSRQVPRDSVVIDGRGSPDEVHERVLSSLPRRLG
jgi:dTMP kinase